jgi:anhydro-N-acetylmuramic acid kinase
MSGTSLDGLDVALCRVSESGKSTKVNVLNFKTWVYPSSVKDEDPEGIRKNRNRFSTLG